MAKTRYVTTRPVEHDGKRYAPDAPIALDDEAAKPLLECGAIVDLSADHAPQPDEGAAES